MKNIPKSQPDAGWTFLTNHSHVLLSIVENPEARGRDLAARVGITERAVQRILADLVAGGYLKVERLGRRNRYKVIDSLTLRHPVEAHCKLAGLIGFVQGTSGQPRKSSGKP